MNYFVQIVREALQQAQNGADKIGATSSQPEVKSAISAANMNRLAQEAIDQFDTDVIIDTGVVRWKNTGRVPAPLYLDFWHYLGKDFKCEASQQMRSIEEAEFFSSEKLRFQDHRGSLLGSPLRDYLSPKYPGAFKSSQDLITKFDSDAEVSGGIVRWKTNSAVPPTDILQLWAFAKKPFDYVESEATRAMEAMQFLDDYRRQSANRVPSEEEIAMARAAHGPGETIVNAITGRKFTT